MIASIRGIATAKTSSQVIVDVQGVGYLVHITPNTSATLKIGSEVTLSTSMIVREDAMTLFGFRTSLEQELFDLLCSVTGVGPKSALAILGTLSAGEIASAVASDNDSIFKAVTGIGPKTAKLITVTLAGKLTHLASNATDNPRTNVFDNFNSVIEALISLGWPERSAAEAVREVLVKTTADAGQDVILRASLTLLGSAKSTSATSVSDN